MNSAPYTACTPPAKNDAAASLAAPAASEPGVCTRNASQWHHIADFLDAQHLEALGLRRIDRATAQSVTPLAAVREARATDLPDGNHGDHNLRTVSVVA